MNGNRAVGNRRNDLSKRLRSDVAYRENTVNIGFRRFVGDYISAAVKRECVFEERRCGISPDADEYSVKRECHMVEGTYGRAYAYHFRVPWRKCHGVRRVKAQ